MAGEARTSEPNRMKPITLILTFATLGIGVALSVRAKAQVSSMKKDYRTALLDAARSQLGKTDPTPYLLDALGYVPTDRLSWCGIFALAMLHSVGLAKGLTWELGKGFLYRLPRTENPLPGDLFYMNANQHHGIVESFEPDGVVTLNGNSVGGAVARVVRDPTTIAAYYSIQPLIDEVS